MWSFDTICIFTLSREAPMLLDSIHCFTPGPIILRNTFSGTDEQGDISAIFPSKQTRHSYGVLQPKWALSN